jgi:hypothetical protein
MSIKIKICLALSLPIVVSSFAQNNEKKDTLTLLDLYNKIEKIEKLIEKTPEQGSKTGILKDENKELKTENKSLKDFQKIKESTIDSLIRVNIRLANKIAKYQKDSLNSQAESNKQKLKLQELDKNEREALQKEINALLNQSYTFPEALLNSLNKRCESLSVKPSNFESLKVYINAHSVINDAYKLLEQAYDYYKNTNAISMLGKLILDNNVYGGLVKNKTYIEKTLVDYCSKTNEIAKKLDAIHAQDWSEDAKRKETVESKEYIVKNYPYLKTQLYKAVEDKTFKIAKIDCQ